MPIYQYLFDDFNNNVVDSTKWIPLNPNSGFTTESGGEMRTPAGLASTGATIMLQDRTFYDIRKGRLAIKFSRGGTTDPNTYTYFGISDPSDNLLTMFGRSSDSNIQIATNAAGPGTSTQTEATMGMGPTWVNGTWLGIYYSETTKGYYLTKSSDGVTWHNMWNHVVTGTSGALNFKRCGLVVGAIAYGTVAPSFTPRWDDASYFVSNGELSARTRYNGALVASSVKVRVSGAWKRPIGLQRFGGTWVRGK